MANKERQKRSARQARAREREALEAAQAAANPSSGDAKRAVKAPSKSEAKKAVDTKKNGFFGRVRTYLRDVRVEMHRVVWPSRAELTNYSVAVIASLLIFGVALWLVDSGFVGLLIGLTGLRP